MGFWNSFRTGFPYANLHSLNLDWILEELVRLREEGVTLSSLRESLNKLIGSNENTAKNADKLGNKTASYYLPVTNLLDNSNFVIAQAGYNAMHGSVKYLCDRWISTVTSGTKVPNGMQFVNTDGIVYQRISGIAGKTLSFAMKTNGTGEQHMSVYTANLGEVIQQIWGYKNIDGIVCGTVTIPSDVDVAAFILYPTNGSVIEWAAVYEGFFTANTIPPYVARPFAVERAQCTRYYRRIKNAIILAPPNIQTYYRAGSIFYEELRIEPSVTLLANENGQYGLCSNVGYITDVDDISIVNRTNGCLGLATSKESFAGRAIQIFDIELSADL